MSKPPVDREDIARLARHSTWRAPDIATTLTREVYANEDAWRSFLHFLLLGAGAAFLLSGIVFFFAYNWEALPGHLKIVIVGGLFLATALFGIFGPAKRHARDVACTAAVTLIGVLFAVLGQVYQTGADSFDYFLAWTLFALPWVAVVHFAPLWLIFVVLLNTTLFTYANQVGFLDDYVITGLIVFGLNTALWAIIRLLWRSRHSFSWLQKLLALWIAVVVTFNLSAGLFDDNPAQLLLTIGLSAALYALWVKLALRERAIHYLALMGTSVLITATFMLLRLIDDDIGGILAAAILVLAGMSALANYLNKLNKQWYGS